MPSNMSMDLSGVITTPINKINDQIDKDFLQLEQRQDKFDPDRGVNWGDNPMGGFLSGQSLRESQANAVELQQKKDYQIGSKTINKAFMRSDIGEAQKVIEEQRKGACSKIMKDLQDK